MESIQHVKRSIRITMAWPAIIVMVGVILLSGCAELKMSVEDPRIENRSIEGTTTAINRNASMTPSSFLGQLWGEISDGVSSRARIMTGRQTPSRTLPQAGWRMDVR